MPRSDTDIGYKWKPIEPLDNIGSSYDFSEIDSLQRQWLSIRSYREESVPHAYNSFLERLDRSWAIETGIIEGLYTLDRGVTETLVQRGFNADLIDRGATNKNPAELVRVLEDHQQASQGVYRYIREGSPLTKSFIRQLHVILTEHQPTYPAYDQFGRRFETPLDRGDSRTCLTTPQGPTAEFTSIAHQYKWTARLTTWWSGTPHLVGRLPSFVNRRMATSCLHPDTPLSGWQWQGRAGVADLAIGQGELPVCCSFQGRPLGIH